MIPFTKDRLKDMVITVVVSIAIAFTIVFVIGMTTVPAREGQYAAPDIQEYFDTLKQPDNPAIPCCGDSDAYFTDKVDIDPDGTLVAIITDEQPDEWMRDNGTMGRRPHMDVGTRVRVPPHKIRKHPIPVPFDHGLIFMNAQGSVYCYEPLGGI